MLTFGGDHFVTYPLLKAHAEKFGKLSLVHFDAHVDTWPDDGKRLDHGSMFLRALNEGLIDPGTSVQMVSGPLAKVIMASMYCRRRGFTKMGLGPRF